MGLILNVIAFPLISIAFTTKFFSFPSERVYIDTSLYFDKSTVAPLYPPSVLLGIVNPFITDKFFRGRNVGDENGSGLGLYIVKELVEKMGGEVNFVNVKPGLEVKLTGIRCANDTV